MIKMIDNDDYVLCEDEIEAAEILCGPIKYASVIREIKKSLDCHIPYSGYLFSYDIDAHDWVAGLMEWMPENCDYYLYRTQCYLNNYEDLNNLKHYCDCTKLMYITRSLNIFEALGKIGIDIKSYPEEGKLLVLIFDEWHDTVREWLKCDFVKEWLKEEDKNNAE
jgi:hypothetical protein